MNKYVYIKHLDYRYDLKFNLIIHLHVRIVIQGTTYTYLLLMRINVTLLGMSLTFSTTLTTKYVVVDVPTGISQPRACQRGGFTGILLEARFSSNGLGLV